ncbi:MAG: hypothetical protein ABIH18_09275, partial [Candidatus Omnitrophota bacterium]
TSNLSFCGSPRGEAEGLTAESIKILSSIIDPALSRRMTEIEFCNSLHRIKHYTITQSAFLSKA